MAMSELDEDELRRKIDEQDRLDAEEIMVNVVLGSAGSVSSRSCEHEHPATMPVTNLSLAKAYRVHKQLSITSIRRARPPSLPPPPMFIKQAVPQRKWRLQKGVVIVVCALGMVAIAAIAGAFSAGVFKIPPSSNRKSSTVMINGKPMALRKMISQNNRVTHTKYNGTQVPFYFLTNAKDFTDRNHSAELPVFWRIPFSGDEAWTEIMGNCMGFIQVTDEKDLIVLHLDDPELTLIDTAKGKLLNIDLTEMNGIELAKSINLVTFPELDAITSPNLNVLNLFDSFEMKSRAITTFRHPAKRMVSLFYGSKDVNSRYFDPSLVNVTLQEYAAWTTDRGEFNFMVKSLVSSGTELIASEEITSNDFELAKNILEQKFMILLIDDKFGSWAKLDAYMGWSDLTQERRMCEDSILKLDWPQCSKEHPPLGADEEAYSALTERNSWDVALYEHAVHLFQLQTNLLVQ